MTESACKALAWRNRELLCKKVTIPFWGDTFLGGARLVNDGKRVEGFSQRLTMPFLGVTYWGCATDGCNTLLRDANRPLALHWSICYWFAVVFSRLSDRFVDGFSMVVITRWKHLLMNVRLRVRILQNVLRFQKSSSMMDLHIFTPQINIFV